MKKVVLPLLILILMISCSCPGTFTALFDKLKPQSTPITESNDVLSLIANDRIRVISTRGEIVVYNLGGRTINMELYNNTDAPLEVIIPCGLVYIPTDPGSSRMVVVQGSEIQFTAGETREIRPFALSIDSLKSLPKSETTYRLEMLEEGKQLDLAKCLCLEDLPAETETQDLVSLQLAAWMIDPDSDITKFPENINDWLKDLTGLPIGIPGLDDTLQNLAGSLAPKAQTWLDKCGIEIEDE